MKNCFLLSAGLFLLVGCTVITYEETRNPEFHFHAEGQDSKIDTRIEGVDVATKRETGQKGESKSAIDADTALSQAGSTLAKTLGDVIMEGVSSKLDQAKTDSDNPITNTTTNPPVVVPVVPPVVEPEPEPDPVKPAFSKKYDHYNPASWEGKGSSIVMCKDEPRMEYCQAYTKTMTAAQMMTLHPAQDKGRDVWTIYDRPGLDGTIVCVKDKKDYAYDISGTGGMQNGECEPVVEPPVGKKTVAYKYAGRTNGNRPTWRLKGSLKVGSKFTFKCGPVGDYGVAGHRKKGIGWEKDSEVVKNSSDHSNQIAILINKKHIGNYKAKDCSITVY